MKQEGHKQKKTRSFRKRKYLIAVQIGLAAGVIWGFFGLLAYYLQFTDVGPSIYAKPVLNSEYELKWQGHFIGTGFFILMTLIMSILYVTVLIKLKGPWPGIGYGIIWWGLVFYVLNPMLQLTKSVKELGANTNSVMISLYVLVGLFIGYSLSAEFNHEDTN